MTAIDKKIEKLEEKKSLLENYKKGVMQQIFSQKICFKDDDGNDYPNWEEKKIGRRKSWGMFLRLLEEMC
jgi:type I restriction enzyme S subunit